MTSRMTSSGGCLDCVLLVAEAQPTVDLMLFCTCSGGAVHAVARRRVRSVSPFFQFWPVRRRDRTRT